MTRRRWEFSPLVEATGGVAGAAAGAGRRAAESKQTLRITWFSLRVRLSLPSTLRFSFITCSLGLLDLSHLISLLILVHCKHET